MEEQIKTKIEVYLDRPFSICLQILTDTVKKKKNQHIGNTTILHLKKLKDE